MSNNFDDYEIIFSDDGSLDKSADIVRELELPNVRVVGYKDNRGKGSSVRTAMLAADGDVVMFTDADLAYGTDVIRRIYDIFAEKPTDIVIGSRNLHKDGYEGYTFMRKVASKVYIKVLCLSGGFKLTDSQTGCKAFSRKAVQDIFTRCEVDGFAFDFEVILWAQKLGYKITEMPVKVINHRESKISMIRDSVRMMKDLSKMKKRINKSN
jgi:dolichyl-phosphate beta-glucosyltransferase